MNELCLCNENWMSNLLWPKHQTLTTFETGFYKDILLPCQLVHSILLSLLCSPGTWYKAYSLVYLPTSCSHSPACFSPALHTADMGHTWSRNGSASKSITLPTKILALIYSYFLKCFAYISFLQFHHSWYYRYFFMHIFHL